MGSWFEHLEDLSPDEVLRGILLAIGTHMGIVLLAYFAMFVSGWISVARTSARAVGRMGRVARAAYRLRPVRAASTLVVTIAVPLAQALAVCLCYVGGNVLSVTVDDAHPLTRVADAIREPSVSEIARAVARLLRFDVIAGSYTVVVIALIVLSYPYARNEKALGRIATCIALPGLALLVPAAGVLMLAGALIAFMLMVSVLMWFFGHPPEFGDLLDVVSPMFPILVGAVVLGMYVLACRAAVFGSRAVVDAWRIDDSQTRTPDR